MGSPALFSGIFAKFLKPNLNLNDNVYILSGSVDPSSSATSAPRGSLYLNTTTGNLYKKTDAGSSTNWTALGSSAPPSSSVYATIGNGYGSVSNKIRRFTTIITNTGSNITYADSATLGASFTINTTGIYSIDYSDTLNTGAADVGVSINASGAQLITAISSLTNTNILAIASSAAGNATGNCGGTFLLNSTDVIRAHTGGTVNSATYCRFVITQVG